MRVDFSCIAVIVPAAGSGRRFGLELPKQYARIAGRPVLAYTLELLDACDFAESVLVTSPADTCWRQVPGEHWKVVDGGASRAASVAAGLAAVEHADWVLVHDAARPCVQVTDIERLADGVDVEAGALLARPVTDTLKRAGNGGQVAGTVDRDGLWRAQTPQLFPRKTLIRALAAMPSATDEAGAVEALGLAPRLIEGDPDNIKLTVLGDLSRAADILARQGRIGQKGLRFE